MPLRFSIIICTWNSMPFLRDCIGSVFVQDYPEVEHVFVDAGSTDGTLELIQSLQRPYRLLKSPGGSLGAAMNAGLHGATGDVIAYLTADDYFLRPDVLSTVAEHLDTSRRGWLFGRSMLDINGELRTEEWATPAYSYRRLLRRNFIPRPATFIRRDLLLRTGGFDTKLRYAMDYDLWLKLGCLSQPIQLDLALAVSREHEGILSARTRLAAMEEDMLVRLAHTGHHPLPRVMHYLRYFVRRQRALQLEAGK